MSLRIEVATVLRALRQVQGGARVRLSDPTARKTIGVLERAETGVTLDKLQELTESLDFDLSAFVILCVSLQRNVSPETVLESSASCLMKFSSAGGVELARGGVIESELVKRPRGQPPKTQVLAEIRRLKSEGKSQSEAARILGVPRSTVQHHWHRI